MLCLLLGDRADDDALKKRKNVTVAVKGSPAKRPTISYSLCALYGHDSISVYSNFETRETTKRTIATEIVSLIFCCSEDEDDERHEIHTAFWLYAAAADCGSGFVQV